MRHRLARFALFLSAAAAPAADSPAAKTIARIWHGRTLAAKADDYEKYLNASGVSMILATAGNRGIEVLRHDEGDKTDFVVVSYWDSIDAIRKFAGPDYRKAVILEKDRQYLLEVEPEVRHYEVVREAGRR